MTPATQIVLKGKITDILNTNRFLAKDKLADLIVKCVANFDAAVSSEISAADLKAPKPPFTFTPENMTGEQNLANRLLQMEYPHLHIGIEFKYKASMYRLTDYKPQNPKNACKLEGVNNNKKYKCPIGLLLQILPVPVK